MTDDEIRYIEKRIARQFYARDLSESGMTLAEIGNKLGISREEAKDLCFHADRALLEFTKEIRVKNRL